MLLAQPRVRPLFVVALITLALAGTPRAQAALIAFEGFDYAAGSLAGANGGAGWGGPWTVANATSLSADAASLSYPPGVAFQTVGRRVSDSTGGFTATRPLLVPLDTNQEGNVAYLSVLMRKLDGSADSGEFGYFQLNHTDVPNQSTAMFVGIGSGETFNVGTWTGTPANVGGAQIGQDYLLVAKIVTHTASNDELFLKVYGPGFTSVVGPEPIFDPGAGPNSDVEWTRVYRALQLTALYNRVQWYGGVNAKFDLDEVRIGTAWLDVTSVPEPSTWVLMSTALALAGAAEWRRRRGRRRSCFSMTRLVHGNTRLVLPDRCYAEA